MHRRTPSLIARAGLSVAIAVSAVIAGSSGAMTAGQTGPYAFTDDPTDRGAICIYEGPGPHELTRFSVRPPSVWWWDTKSTNDRQRGTVGWQILVQVAEPGAYGPWETVLRSTVQKATAYEDPDGAPGDPDGADDPTARAPFTRRGIDFDGTPWASFTNAHARIIVKAMWYRRDGSVAGSVRHTVFHYAWRNVFGLSGSTTACPLVTSGLL